MENMRYFACLFVLITVVLLPSSVSASTLEWDGGSNFYGPEDLILGANLNSTYNCSTENNLTAQLLFYEDLSLDPQFSFYKYLPVQCGTSIIPIGFTIPASDGYVTINIFQGAGQVSGLSILHQVYKYKPSSLSVSSNSPVLHGEVLEVKARYKSELYGTFISGAMCILTRDGVGSPMAYDESSGLYVFSEQTDVEDLGTWQSTISCTSYAYSSKEETMEYTVSKVPSSLSVSSNSPVLHGEVLEVTADYKSELDGTFMSGATCILTRDGVGSPMVYDESRNLYVFSEQTAIADVGEWESTVSCTKDTHVSQDEVILYGVVLSLRSSIITTPDWPDYVFESEYTLAPLFEVEQYVSENKHLSGIPSRDEVGENPVNAEFLVSKLLEKIEEITLYLISHQKEIETNTDAIGDMQTQLQTLSTNYDSLSMQYINLQVENQVLNGQVSSLKARISNTPIGVSGLSLWLDASKITGVADRGKVSRWTDFSEEGYDVIQASEDKQPQYVANGVDGLPVVRFDGIDDYMDTDFVGPGGEEVTVFVVGKPNVDYGLRSVVRFQDEDGGFMIYPWVSGGNYRPAVSSQTDVWDNNLALDAGFTTGNWSVGSFTWKSGQENGYRTYVNGVLMGQKNASNTTLPMERLSICAYVGSWTGEHTDADIAEILVYNKALTSEEQGQIENYLSQKYDVMLG